MKIVALASDDDANLFGTRFDALKGFLISIGRMGGTAPSTSWRVNGYAIASFSTGSEDGTTVDKGLFSFNSVMTRPSYFVPSRSKTVSRWRLMLNYNATESDTYDYEHTFNVYDRHDEVVGQETNRMALTAITLTTFGDEEYPKPPMDLVKAEVTTLYDYWKRVVESTKSLDEWSASGYSMDIRCDVCFSSRRLAASQIPTTFGANSSREDAIRRLRCRECGWKGQATLSPIIPPTALLAQFET